MPTISRMTPEDLTAIGIKKPHHRKRLKTEIGRLNIGDGLPSYLPASLEEWLRLLRLEEYGPQLRAQGYHTIQVKLPATLEEWLRLLRLEEFGPQLRAQGYHTIQVKLPATLEEWLQLLRLEEYGPQL
jgi:hypothetical protein